MKRLKYITFLSAVSLLTLSCNSDMLNENPPHFTTVDKLYVSGEGFQAGLNGLYGSARSEREGYTNTSGVGWQYHIGLPLTVAMDDISTGGNTSGAPAQLVSKPEQYNVPSGAYVKRVFPWLYSIVNAANTIILRAEAEKANSYNWKISGVDQRKRIIGEALVFRAWSYRILMAFWGDVPLNLQESSGSNIRNDWERTPQKEIRQRMVKDLELAAEYIPWRPYTAGSITKGVALHYLAETYLALSVDDPANAATYAAQAERFASILIGDTPSADDLARFGRSDRSLMADFNAMFAPKGVDYAANTETLWTWQWALNVVGGGDNLMRHTFNTYYTGAREGFGKDAYYNKNTIRIAATTERGSWGWCQAYITPRVMELYYKSSTNKPYSSQNDNSWRSFQYEDRGNDKALMKYFIYDKESDPVTEDIGINPTTGLAWATGDTVWFAKNGNNGDPATKANAYGIAYQKIGTAAKFGNRNNYIYSAKFRYSDSGYQGATSSHFNQMYLRLGESYLVRAEARVRLGNPAGAADDINALRTRANAREVGAADLGVTTMEQLDYILDERSRELLCEEHRRVTLSRMGRKDFLWRRIQQYNAKDADIFRKSDILFAIPETVISANATPFPQNPGLPGGPAIDDAGWPAQPPAWTYQD